MAEPGKKQLQALALPDKGAGTNSRFSALSELAGKTRTSCSVT